MKFSPRQERLFRFGVDQDPDISIEITADDEEFCFIVDLGDGVPVKMHARTLVDLMHKSQKAFLDWVRLSHALRLSQEASAKSGSRAAPKLRAKLEKN